MTNEATVATNDTIEFLYAQAILRKLFKSNAISYEVYLRAEQTCREKLNAA